MAPGGPPGIKIEPLGQHHDRAAFCCGVEGIDSWCRKAALKEHTTFRCRVFSATEENSGAVVGVYSLTVRSLAPKTLLGWGGWDIPAIYLGRLGVCTTHAKRGIGAALMTDAFKRSLLVTENVGAFCLWLESISVEKAKYYEGLGFARFKPNELGMYVLMETLRDAFKPPAV